MTRITIATCRMFPKLEPSAASYAEALRDLGAEVTLAGWNTHAAQAFLDADLTVLRQTWDYQVDAAGFAAWIARMDRLGARIANPAPIAIWNNDKRTIAELGRAGFAVPETVDLDAEDPAAAAARIDTEQLVVKPAYGGGGWGVRLATPANLADTLAEAQAETPGRPFLAQPFLPEIADGEWSLCFFAGQFSHACLKIPAKGEFRVNSRFAPRIRAAEPPARVIETASRIARFAGDDLLYARIDGVVRDGGFLCTELELTDPDLHLSAQDGTARRLAEATLAHAGAPVEA